MTNKEYLDNKIEKIKSSISTFIDRNITPIALVFTAVEVSLIICAIKISPFFWIPAIPLAYLTSILVCAVVWEWLEKEHKEKK